MDEVDSTNVAEFFTHENERDESKSVSWFTKMTGEETPKKESFSEEPEPEVETDSRPVVESEQDPGETPAPDGEGTPEGELPDDPDAEEQGAGQSQSSDELQSIASRYERQAELLSRQLAQAQWQLSQQAAQAQQVVDPEPPRWHQMSPAQQEQLQREAAEIGAEPFELLTERRAEWKARQVLSEYAQQANAARAEARHGEFVEAAQRVLDFAEAFEQYAPHIRAEFDGHPEFFEVARQMEPAAMERTLKRFLSGLAAEAKLKSYEAREKAVAESSRRAGREEAQAGRTGKVNSTRTQAARVNTVTPNLQSAPQAPKSTASFIKELAAGRASQTWE